MKVYVVLQQTDWDYEDIRGVFTDKEQAKKYAEKSFKDFHNYENHIVECELNKYLGQF